MPNTWPSLPPPPPGPVSATGRDVLATIEQIGTIPTEAPRVHYAQSITDLQAICAAAFEAMARTVAAAQPPGRSRSQPGPLSLTELGNITGWSIPTVARMVRRGRRLQQEDPGR